MPVKEKPKLISDLSIHMNGIGWERHLCNSQIFIHPSLFYQQRYNTDYSVL